MYCLRRISRIQPVFLIADIYSFIYACIIIKLKHYIKGKKGGGEEGRKGGREGGKAGGKTFPYNQFRLKKESSTIHWVPKNDRDLDKLLVKSCTIPTFSTL